MHTNVFFTEDRSIFKRGNSTCRDSFLASHILPLLAFCHLFIPSFCAFIVQYSSLFKSDCLFIAPWIPVPILTYHVFLCLNATYFILPSLDTKIEIFWGHPPAAAGNHCSYMSSLPLVSCKFTINYILSVIAFFQSSWNIFNKSFPNILLISIIIFFTP